jgi:CPA2 family monovalent cation:H+ antiporter-2
MHAMSPSYLVDVLIILAAAAVLVPLCQRLRLGPVLGYLIAGIAVGPDGMGLVGNIDVMQTLGDLGIVFLLFTIGLEFTRERLRLINGRIYMLGVSQIVVTSIVLAWCARWAGFEWGPAILIGSSLALSSTAIVLPVLSHIGKLASPMGRIAIAILLLQDLTVGPVLVLVETLSRGGNSFAAAFALAVGKAAAAIIIILIAGQLVLRPLFRIVASAHSPELFVGTVLLVALATSGGTEIAGLSMAFGGFLAGLLLSETEYRHQVAADVEPFRGLLLGLFFVTVGMTVDPELAWNQIGLVLLLSLGLMLGKAVLLAALACAFGTPMMRSLRLSGLLAQGGEFAFIALGAAAAGGVLDWPSARLLIVVVAVTMMVTPAAITSGVRLLAWLEMRGVRAAATLVGEVLQVEDHVIIVGYGEIGRIVARMLKAYGVAYIILDLDPEHVKQGREAGEPIYLADATRPEVLRGVRAEDAIAVVVAVETAGVAQGLAALRRHVFPHLNILVRGGSQEDIVNLRRAGLTPVGQEATDAGLKLTGAILDLMHPPGRESAS